MLLPPNNVTNIYSSMFVLHCVIVYFPGEIGHYICYIKNHSIDQWFVYNDSVVKKVSSNDIRGQIRGTIYIRKDKLKEFAI